MKNVKSSKEQRKKKLKFVDSVISGKQKREKDLWNKFFSRIPSYPLDIPQK